MLSRPAVIGVTQTSLTAARPGSFDRGDALEVTLLGGELQSVSSADVLAGANLAAIGDGSPGGWEVFQFAEAELVAPLTYRLCMRLRGQAGTDGVMPPVWPEGSWFVLLNGADAQLDLPPNLRGVEQHLRIGPVNRGYDDASYVHVQQVFEGIGLRPYAPCHLRRDVDEGGETRLTWIRRTRVDGDSWTGDEAPLGEERESYLLRILQGETVLREETVTSPWFIYPQAARVADGVTGLCTVTVAQVSARFGPGPEARLVTLF